MAPPLQPLSLSLQFARFDGAAEHRAALPRHKVARWIRHALALPAEITVRIVGEDEGRQLNRDYRQKDYATNVLSFALNEGESWFDADNEILSGDLIICPQVVLREAAEQGKTAEAHFAHLTLHGTLHLMGYDHLDDDEAEIMEALEIKLMNQLGYANPYSQDEH